MKDNHEKEIDSISQVQLLEKVFDHLAFGIAIVSPQLDVLDANQQFYEIINSSGIDSTSQETAKSFLERQDITPHLYSQFENAEYDTVKDVEWQTEEGHYQYIRIRTQLLQKELNLPIKILLTLSDVSEIKQAEKTHDTRVRHMMHELRNPLSNISLCVELLADSTKEGNQEDTELFLSKAAASVQRMKQLINDLNGIR